MSEFAELLDGVPQGSVLGPIKYCIYILPIGAIIQSHGLNDAIYAYYTEVDVSFDVSDPKLALNILNSCLLDTRTWMLQNKLKINDDKTEFLLIGTPNTRTKIMS